ncbi:MAG: DUF1839 family protein [Steroidobacteraceae bacterium]
MTRLAVIPGLDPATYQRHPVHAEERTWVEKNCYVDIWLEVVHALGADPMAMLPFVVALDFEGDQWTFFKPPHDELRDLYGIDVQELNVWRPLLDHTIEHLANGKMISTEADAYWLPDTSGTDYRTQHTKTTIVIQSIDRDAERLGYFHNAGYHELGSEDFRRIFRTDVPPDTAYMPLFAEFIRSDRLRRRPAGELADMSLGLLRRHLARRPGCNPVDAFQARFLAEAETIRREGIGYYHAWAFATTRQLGAAFELAALHARWLADAGYPGFEPVEESFRRISSEAKTFILKAARVAGARRALDFSAHFAVLAESWARGIEAADRAARSG